MPSKGNHAGKQLSLYPACELQGRSCTLGTYGGIFVGVLGQVVTPTNIIAVLMIDAVATDVFPTDDPQPTFTLYNPHHHVVWVGFNDSALSIWLAKLENYDLFDLVSATTVAVGSSAAKTCGVRIEADAAVVLEARTIHEGEVGSDAP